VNHSGFTGAFRVKVSWVVLSTVMPLMSSGIELGVYPAQPVLFECSMFIQNMTSWTVTVSPSDHL